jgi:uncharacterized damage-inducible protein DinB
MGTVAENFLPDYDAEMDRVRDTLVRAPGDRLDWRPHPRARSLGELLLHLARIPGWTGAMLDAEAHDLARREPAQAVPPREEILALFDANRATARSAIAGRSDEELAAPWRLERSGTILRVLPRARVLRVFLLDHLIHHRGQLVTYLRMLDVPAPALYGTTADDP